MRINAMKDFKTPYIEITHDIEIQAAPIYLEDESHPEKGQYFFMYAIKIINHRPESIQLTHRRWVINNGHRESKVVEGEGIVGEQPDIGPGGEYQYRSFCPLDTPTGNMRGSFFFENEIGKKIEAKIPLFFLRTLDRPGRPDGLYDGVSP